MQVSGETWRPGLRGRAGPGRRQVSAFGQGQQPAERVDSPPKPCVACVQDFKLDFGHSQGKASEAWHGGMATIFPSPGRMGSSMESEQKQFQFSDKQDGVNCGIYVPIEITVYTQEGEVTYRSYQMKTYEYSSFTRV